METKSGVDLDAAEGGLKELVLRWFTETQAPLILHNGNFPDWFQGLAARKDAEDLLRDKALGCFLIRLSDKAIGYILSYKGHDRCRHFVITQNPSGEFVIAGDSQLFGSLAELIEHYKVSPIEPFGECLTSSCCEEDTGELYDMVNTKGRSGISVQALRTMWDQKKDNQSDAGKTQRFQHQHVPVAAQPPVLPPKSATRKLTGTVSIDVTSLPQGAKVPPVPKRGIPLGFSLSGSLPDTTFHPCEAQSEPNRVQRIRRIPNPALTSDRDSGSKDYPDDPHLVGVSDSHELNQVENRSRSLPQLDNNNMEEKYSNWLSSSFTASIPPKRITCVTYSLHTPSAEGSLSSRFEQQSDKEEPLKSNPLYQSSEAPGGSLAQQGEGMYAEVPQEPRRAGPLDETYEQIPEKDAEVQNNTYESLEDMKTKKPKSTWGKNNVKWKKFLPDYKRK
ncbi:uncharacterized protein sh2d7 [Xenentodon cancila]